MKFAFIKKHVDEVAAGVFVDGAGLGGDAAGQAAFAVAR